MFGMSMDIGIDLGTTNVLVFVKDKGIVLREPSVVAINRDNNQMLAIGEDARQMIGRTPGNIAAIRPLREGVIANYALTESMLRFFIEKVVGRSVVFRPRVMICIPPGLTKVEQRAVQEAAEQSGARQVQLIEEPLAAAMGANLDIVEAQGAMVINIGGGTTDVAVISLGGIVTSDSIRIAGDTFDDEIMEYVKREFNMIIGEHTAEQIKMRVGAAYTAARREQMEIRGRDLLLGLPKHVTISTAQASSAIDTSVMHIVDCVKRVLEETPPELMADIMDRGIVLTGGSALLCGMAELIAHHTGASVVVADDPMSCVALRCGKALDFFDRFHSKGLRLRFMPKK